MPICMLTHAYLPLLVDDYDGIATALLRIAPEAEAVAASLGEGGSVVTFGFSELFFYER